MGSVGHFLVVNVHLAGGKVGHGHELLGGGVEERGYHVAADLVHEGADQQGREAEEQVGLQEPAFQ